MIGNSASCTGMRDLFERKKFPEELFNSLAVFFACSGIRDEDTVRIDRVKITKLITDIPKQRTVI